MKKAATLNGLIHPTVASYIPEELAVTDLPFVKEKGKGKKVRRLYWQVKPTGDHVFDSIIGRTYAIELMQYMMMKPGSTWLFPVVTVELLKKEKNKAIRRSFMATIAELAIVGANARVKGIHVDTVANDEVEA